MAEARLQTKVQDKFKVENISKTENSIEDKKRSDKD